MSIVPWATVQNCTWCCRDDTLCCLYSVLYDICVACTCLSCHGQLYKIVHGAVGMILCVACTRCCMIFCVGAVRYPVLMLYDN